MSNFAPLRMLLAFLAICLLATPLQGQDSPVRPAQFDVELSPPEPEIGQRATLVVTPEPGIDARELQGTLSGLRIGNFERQPDGSFVATVHPLRSGTYGLEEMRIDARLASGDRIAAGLSPFAFTVPEPDHVENVDDYTGLFGAARTLWPYLLAGMTVGIIGLALLLLVAWLVRRWLKARAMAASLPTPLPSPIDEAFQALESLESLEEYRAQGTKAHYVALSMLLRRYLERQWHRPAMEMSEDEVSDLLRAEFSHRPGVSGLNKVFAAASMAKFARMEVTLEDVYTHLKASRAFLTSERDRVRAADLAQRVAQRPNGREAA